MHYLQDKGIKPTIHTDACRYLINGKEIRNELNLFKYAKMVNELYKMSKAGDPYSQWYILKCYQAILNCDTELQAIKKKLVEQFEQEKISRGVEIDLLTSKEPFSEWIRFAHQAGDQCVYLISTADYICRLLITFTRRNIDPIGKITTQQICSKIRDVLSTPKKLLKDLLKFKEKDSWATLTRKEIFEDHEKAIRMKAELGEVPADLLYNRITCAYVPELRQRGNENE